MVAHPDDESFGMGALLDRWVGAGAEVVVLCFTHGEASTLHGSSGDLATVRTAEFAAAAKILGIGRTELLDYADGRLSDVDMSELAEHVRRIAAEVRPSHLLGFDVGGVTGHPDHDRATAVAMAAATAMALPVWGWAVPQEVAAQVNTEFGTAFCGRPPSELDWTLRVDRTRQWRAIAAHASQSGDNPVLLRRLELLGYTCGCWPPHRDVGTSGRRLLRISRRPGQLLDEDLASLVQPGRARG